MKKSILEFKDWLLGREEEEPLNPEVKATLHKYVQDRQRLKHVAANRQPVEFHELTRAELSQLPVEDPIIRRVLRAIVPPATEKYTVIALAQREDDTYVIYMKMADRQESRVTLGKFNSLDKAGRKFEKIKRMLEK